MSTRLNIFEVDIVSTNAMDPYELVVGLTQLDEENLLHAMPLESLIKYFSDNNVLSAVELLAVVHETKHGRKYIKYLFWLQKTCVQGKMCYQICWRAHDPQRRVFQALGIFRDFVEVNYAQGDVLRHMYLKVPPWWQFWAHQPMRDYAHHLRFAFKHIKGLGAVYMAPVASDADW